MDIQLNAGAQKAFDSRSIEGIVPDDSYPVWTRKDPFRQSKKIQISPGWSGKETKCSCRMKTAKCFLNVRSE